MSPQKLMMNFAELEESATALLPDRYIRAAEESLRKEKERNSEASDSKPSHLERMAGA
jgi:hypothetical protein